jgi:hypothetical protein
LGNPPDCHRERRRVRLAQRLLQHRAGGVDRGGAQPARTQSAPRTASASRRATSDARLRLRRPTFANKRPGLLATPPMARPYQLTAAAPDRRRCAPGWPA